MKQWMRRLIAALKYSLCAMPLFIFFAQLAYANPWFGLAIGFASGVCAWAISFLPGRLGKEPAVEPAEISKLFEAGKYDKYGELTYDISEDMPSDPRDQRFPLRAASGLLVAILGIIVCVIVVPIGNFAQPVPKNAAVWQLLLWRSIVGITFAAALMTTLRLFALYDFEMGSELFIGLVVYVLAALLLSLAPEGFLYPDTKKIITALAVLFLSVSVLSFNRSAVQSSAGSTDGAAPPRQVMRTNRLWALGFVFTAFAAGSFDSIRGAMQKIWWALGDALRALFAWLSGLFARDFLPPSQPQAPPAPMSISGETADPSWWAQFLEKLFMVIAYIFAAAIALFVMYKLWGKLKKLFVQIGQHISGFSDAIAADYQDEKQSLLRLRGAKGGLAAKIQKRLKDRPPREKKWSRMDVREQIRFIVRRQYKKAAPEIPDLPVLTIQSAAKRLNLEKDVAQALADAYDQARYSLTPPKPENAENLRKDVGL